MRKITLLFSLLLSLTAFAGDPIPGIDITVDQSPPGIYKSGTTNKKGELVVSGLRPGPFNLIVKRYDMDLVIGNRPHDKIAIPAKGQKAQERVRVELLKYAGKKVRYSNQNVECKEFIEVTPMEGGQVKIKVTCED